MLLFGQFLSARVITNLPPASQPSIDTLSVLLLCLDLVSFSTDQVKLPFRMEKERDRDSKRASASIFIQIPLEEARKLTPSWEILLWMTPSEAPNALQASECSELLDPMRVSCWIFA